MENITITVFLIASPNFFSKVFYVFKKYLKIKNVVNLIKDKLSNILDKSEQSTARVILTCSTDIFSNKKFLTLIAAV